ncbi:hypothetical protein FU659_07605 [Paenibacillus sp. N3.4]|nr:hypothetical protein FU659_07605 [Paenibacillus sp. N3.4]
MEKKTQNLLFGLIIVSLICSAFIYNQQKKVEHGIKMTLESIVGSSLFKIWSTYEAIASNPINKLTIEHLVDIHDKLSVMEANSETVDSATSTDLLNPINKNMIAITESIKNNYEENKRFTEDDQIKFSTFVQKTNELLSILTRAYYVPGSHEGAKVTLKMNNKEELIAFRDNLGKYMSSVQ